MSEAFFEEAVTTRVKTFLSLFFMVAAIICYALDYQKSFSGLLAVVCLIVICIISNRTKYIHMIDSVIMIICTVIITGIFLHGIELAPMAFFFVLIMAVSGLLILGTYLGTILAVYYIVLVCTVCWTPFLPDTRALYGDIYLRRIPLLLIGFIGMAYIICYKVRNYDKKHKQYTKQLEDRIRVEQDKLGDMSVHLVTTMFHAESAKSPEITMHSERVAKLSQKIANRLGMSSLEQDRIYYAGLLHDVGKMHIRDLKLELDEDERREASEQETKLKGEVDEGAYQFHVEKGSIFMKHLQLPKEITDAAMYHHENYDGTGFPQGLRGEEIPMSARIVAVADSIVNERTQGSAIWKVVSLLESKENIYYDPVVVNAAIEVLYSL